MEKVKYVTQQGHVFPDESRMGQPLLDARRLLPVRE